MFVFLGEFLLELAQFHLILPEQSALVDVFVDARLVLDLFGAGCELKSGDRLTEAL